MTCFRQFSWTSMVIYGNVQWHPMVSDDDLLYSYGSNFMLCHNSDVEVQWTDTPPLNPGNTHDVCIFSFV